MHILLINPPYHAVTSLYGLGAQTPLGLLLVGGALLDAGHRVSLIDAEARRLSSEAIAAEAASLEPDVIMTGHAGSTPAHPTVVRVARALKAVLPAAPIVYGGVFPTYHGKDILTAEAAIDIVVRGEGERTSIALARALETGAPLAGVPGLFYRECSQVLATPEAETMCDLDRCRAAWELIEDWDLYQCWGVGRSAVIQFSRGCPHLCDYCGQRVFWRKWRHRDPRKTAAEIAWLYREKGVRFVDLADENPTSSKRMWRDFLEAIIAEGVPVKLFATIRATDIVRDAGILHLYRQAGIECVLMGLETTDPATLLKIRKGSTTDDGREAIRLLRAHGILSMAGHIAGFAEERWRDHWNALRQLLLYDPDLLNAMYVTPHRWTEFYRRSQDRELIELDQSKWDYRHQLLGTRYLRPWQLFASVKLTELIMHLRPRVLLRALFYSGQHRRRAYRWCMLRASRVWRHELMEFLQRRGRQPQRQSLGAHWGEANHPLPYRAEA